MTSDLASSPLLRVLVVFTAAIVASQAWPAARLMPLLPGSALHTVALAQADDPSRSPSSDALMQAVPLRHSADRLDALARTLPVSPGVIVAHGPADRLTPAYYVMVMRLWPRQAHLVTCDPQPRIESFRAPVLRESAWRVDLIPGDADPLRASAGGAVDARALCASP